MENQLYREASPRKELADFVDSFWMHKNPFDNEQIVTISASSYLKLVFWVSNSKIIYYVLTGLWTRPKEIHVPPKTTVYGCRMKILAPEFLLQREMASLMNQMLPLALTYLNLANLSFYGFESIKEQWEEELLKMKSPKTIQDNKLRLSDLLYSTNDNISTKEVANRIFWTNRQINRYLNKYIGLSLKKYLNLQKCRESFAEIVDGEFFPGDKFYDRPHFIREIKKYTGTTPKRIFQQKNDRFIQLKNISKK